MTSGTDSPVAGAFRASPNHGERRGTGRSELVVLHYTGMSTGEAALARLCDPRAEVSCHYLVWEDGRVDQLVREDRRAWHAGASCWKGDRDINSASIGIEIVNPGHDGGLPPFPEIQIAAVAALCVDIRSRLTIALPNFLGHSDVAPGRKVDPGERFPWRRLYERGVGLWAEPGRIGRGSPLVVGDSGPRVERLRAELARLGYDLAPGDVFDDRTCVVVEAFQRHFRPACIDGVADAETRARLRALLDRQVA